MERTPPGLSTSWARMRADFRSGISPSTVTSRPGRSSPARSAVPRRPPAPRSGWTDPPWPPGHPGAGPSLAATLARPPRRWAALCGPRERGGAPAPVPPPAPSCPAAARGGPARFGSGSAVPAAGHRPARRAARDRAAGSDGSPTASRGRPVPTPRRAARKLCRASRLHLHLASPEEQPEHQRGDTQHDEAVGQVEGRPAARAQAHIQEVGHPAVQ